MTPKIRMQIGETVVSWGTSFERSPVNIDKGQRRAWSAFAVVEGSHGQSRPPSAHRHSTTDALSLSNQPARACR